MPQVLQTFVAEVEEADEEDIAVGTNNSIMSHVLQALECEGEEADGGSDGDGSSNEF